MEASRISWSLLKGERVTEREREKTQKHKLEAEPKEGSPCKGKSVGVRGRGGCVGGCARVGVWVFVWLCIHINIYIYMCVCDSACIQILQIQYTHLSDPVYVVHMCICSHLMHA